MALKKPPKWSQPHKAHEIPPSGPNAMLISPETNAEAGVYGKFAKSATKEYGVECVRLIAMIAASMSSPTLTDRDRTFVWDMKSKMDRAGSGFVASQGQVYWLRDIKDRLVERGEI